MKNTLTKDYIDATLFLFLKSIYRFQSSELEMFGVTWQEVYLLQILIREPHMRVTDLSKELQVEKFTTSRLITRLEKEGLVVKSNSKEDKRVVRVDITQKGVDSIHDIEAYHYKLIQQQFDRFEENELRVILSSIGRLDELLVDRELKNEGE